MFSIQLNIDNFLIPVLSGLFVEILMWFFVQIVEHLKKLHFFIDKKTMNCYIN